MDTTMAHRAIPGMQTPAHQRRSQPRLSSGMRTPGLATDELVKLHHALAEALPAASGVVTQLVAPEPDASIAHVAYDLAYISASWLDKRVLFVDGTGKRTGDADTLLPTDPDPWFSSSFDPADLEASICRVVGS